MLGRRLRQAGYEVREPAQEHSFVPDMWQRLAKPDRAIFLDASLRTIQRRGRLGWTQTYLDEQQKRLQHARAHCDYYLQTDELSEDEVFARVLAWLSVDR